MIQSQLPLLKTSEHYIMKIPSLNPSYLSTTLNSQTLAFEVLQASLIDQLRDNSLVFKMTLENQELSIQVEFRYCIMNLSTVSITGEDFSIVVLQFVVSICTLTKFPVGLASDQIKTILHAPDILL